MEQEHLEVQGQLFYSQTALGLGFSHSSKFHVPVSSPWPWKPTLQEGWALTSSSTPRARGGTSETQNSAALSRTSAWKQGSKFMLASRSWSSPFLCFWMVSKSSSPEAFTTEERKWGRVYSTLLRAGQMRASPSVLERWRMARADCTPPSASIILNITDHRAPSKIQKQITMLSIRDQPGLFSLISEFIFVHSIFPYQPAFSTIFHVPY